MTIPVSLAGFIVLIVLATFGALLIVMGIVGMIMGLIFSSKNSHIETEAENRCPDKIEKLEKDEML